MDSDGVIWMDTSNRPSGDAADIKFYFNGPLTFDDPSDVISFNITVDADNPADLDPGYNPGKTTGITIDRSLIDAYDPALNGVISNYDQYREIIGYALSFYDADAHAHGYAVWDSALQASVPEVDAIGIRTSETSGLDGSYVGISGFFTNVGSGGLGNGSDWGLRGSQMDLAFSPFTLYKDGEEPDGVEVSFTFGVNGEPPKSYSFNRTFVNELLGKDNGKIETADEMVTLLQTLMADDWPHVTIEATSSSNISITSDKAFDRLAGMKTGIGFTGISVNIEPLSELNFRDIDIVANPNMTDVYLTYMELVHSDVISAAAVLGSLQKRIDMQSDFTRKLMDSVDSGIGRLIDADMEEESSRLVAQQTQQQLATQALYIANRDSSNFLRLFQ
jgi:flagellin